MQLPKVSFIWFHKCCAPFSLALCPPPDCDFLCIFQRFHLVFRRLVILLLGGAVPHNGPSANLPYDSLFLGNKMALYKCMTLVSVKGIFFKEIFSIYFFYPSPLSGLMNLLSFWQILISTRPPGWHSTGKVKGNKGWQRLRDQINIGLLFLLLLASRVECTWISIRGAVRKLCGANGS